MNSQVSFGEYIRHLRRRRRWGLQDLAQETGLSLSHLSRLENDNGIPNPATVVKLAQALDADLERMLELAKCLPREILDRLARRVAGEAQPHRRTAGDQPRDPTFARALVEDIDPALRSALAKTFKLSDEDVEGIFAMLRRVALMSPSERETVLRFLTPDTVEGDGGSS